MTQNNENDISSTSYQKKKDYSVSPLFHKPSNPPGLINLKMNSNKNFGNLKFTHIISGLEEKSDKSENSKLFSKFHSNTKLQINNNINSLSKHDTNKNKVDISRFAHVFGDSEEKLEQRKTTLSSSFKFDTTRSVSTKAGSGKSEGNVCSLKVIETKTDDGELTKYQGFVPDETV